MIKKLLTYVFFLGALAFLTTVIFQRQKQTSTHSTVIYSSDFVTKISFKEKNIKVGTISIDKAHEARGYITIYNTGEHNLFINKLEVSCSCSSGDIPKRPISPNDSIKLEITYNKTIPGYFYSDVLVHGNFESSPAIFGFEGQLITQNK
ncbi:DUF1573 domain-containing protein [Roseivirga pacifica]|uniref:DUF1573 domain-containing protein n=1 Tax=Roseivirga pacifica TaxID=1267423 RepID=UPI003BAF7F74